MEAILFDVQISKQFLTHLNELTKMAIKVYLSLVFLKQKRGDFFTASHSEISLNVFGDNKKSFCCEWFGVRTDAGQYFKAFKQLETLGLIKVYRSKTKNGGNKPNKYRVY
jgi:hypothetical protein